MNEPLDDLAAELARLRPNDPSDRLNRRVEQALGMTTAPPPNRVAQPWWFRWAPLAAAAALVLVAAVTVALRHKPTPPLAAGSDPEKSAGPTSPSAQSPGLEPVFRRVNQAHYLLEAADAGLIFTSGATPWRKVRWQFLTTSEWRDERDKTTVKVIIPREETVVIPVHLQ